MSKGISSFVPVASARGAKVLAGAGLALIAVGLAVLALHALAGLGGSGTGPHAFYDHSLYAALMVAPALLCLARVVLVPSQRLAWGLIGGGLAAWAVGDIYWVSELAGVDDPPFPNPYELAYSVSYPLFIGGLIALIGPRVRGLPASSWLDAVLGAIAITAIGGTVLLGSVVAAIEGWTPVEQLATIAFPVGDVFLLAFVGAILMLTGMRAGRQLGILLAALTVSALADAIFSYQSAVGSYAEGTWLDLMWPLAAALIGFAAWRTPDHSVSGRLAGWRSLVLPTVFLAAAVLVRALQGFETDGTIEAATAAAVLLVLAVRMVVAYAENHRLLQRVQTDPLTGLANRGKLTLDLDNACGQGEREWQLAYFDLDGFKLYNDTYGHPAGDALLARLGERLRRVTPPDGEAYRIGGDEFCILLPGDAGRARASIADAASALRDRGAGFAVTSSYGVATIPIEASTPEAALQLADRRLYDHKDSTRSSAANQAEAVLLRTMRERTPDLGVHGTGVARLAALTGERLGLEPTELVTLIRAAELHDIGKVAIPDALLEKPSPLTDEEWEFMRQHTILGERILHAAPALSGIARIVRSTHERFDGSGYPDGLAGDAIPEEARIIFACDAYDAMTSERPYAAPMTTEQARAELHRCAGSQFDPRVVDALCSVLEVELAGEDRALTPADPAGVAGAPPSEAPVPAS